MLRRLTRCLFVACVLLAAGAVSALASVPAGFVGVNVDGPLYPTAAPGVNASAQYKLMEQSGVESVRAVFSWSYAQPYQSETQVPAAQRSQFIDVGGVPTRFGQIDALVAHAAQYGMSVLPTVLYAPSWDATGASKYTLPEPARTGPYAAFLTALVHRYGPGGSFWKTHRYAGAIPVTDWQIWNEPNLSYDWPTQPFAPSYMALVKAASTAVKQVDPSARIVLGGLANYSWQALATIYKVPGARADFDVVDAHPYTAEPSGVITILKYVRQVMDDNGDRATPLIAGEVGWASSQGHANPADGGVVASTTLAGQASDTSALLPMLAEDRSSLGLSAFDVYDWASTEKNGFNFSYSGLLRYSDQALHAAPVYAAFRARSLAMEDCRVKGPVATACLQP